MIKNLKIIRNNAVSQVSVINAKDYQQILSDLASSNIDEFNVLKNICIALGYISDEKIISYEQLLISIQNLDLTNSASSKRAHTATIIKNKLKKNVAIHFYGYIKKAIVKRYSDSLKAKNLNDTVIFDGPLSEEEFHKCLRQSQLIITPYEDSHASGVILKAMGHGTPVLSSKVGSIPEYLGDMGEYFSLDDPMSLAKKIMLLMEDPSRRNSIGRGLWEKAKNEYAWNVVAEKTLQVYREVLESKR